MDQVHKITMVKSWYAMDNALNGYYITKANA